MSRGNHIRRLLRLGCVLVCVVCPALVWAGSVRLAPVDPLTFHVVVRGDSAFSGGEIGLRFALDDLVLQEVRGGPDLPSGESLPGGVPTLVVDSAPESQCAADPLLDGALTVAWIHASEDGDVLTLPGHEEHRVLTLEFAPGPGVTAGGCTSLEFASCLGPAVAPVRNVLTDRNGHSMRLVAEKRIACDTGCRVIAFEPDAKVTCDSLSVEILESSGTVIDVRDIDVSAKNGHDLALEVLGSYRATGVAGFTFASSGTGVIVCRDAGAFEIRIDGELLEAGRTSGACGVDVMIELPECPDRDGDGVCDADDCQPEVFNESQDDCPSIGFCRRVKFDPLCAFKCEFLIFELRESDGLTAIPDSRRVVSIEGDGTGRDIGIEFCRAYRDDPPPGFTAHATRSGCKLCRTDGSSFRIFLEHDLQGQTREQEITIGGVTAACGLRIWPEEPGCSDRDGDGVCDEVDRCPDDFDPSQGDLDADCLGDACELEEGLAVQCDGAPSFVPLGGSVGFEAPLDPCRRGACFSFETDAPGQPIIVSLADENSAQENAIWFQWGREASPFDAFAGAARRGSASQRLLIPAARDEPGFVLVRSDGRDASSTVFVRVEVLDVALERITPRRAAAGTRISARIRGAGFTPTTEFRLVPSSGGASEIDFESLEYLGSELVEVTLTVPEDAPVGTSYDLEAADRDIEFPALEEAFEIIPIELATGLEVSLSFGDIFRQGVISRGTLRVRNLGSEETTPPIIELSTRFGQFLDGRDLHGPTATNLIVPGELLSLRDLRLARNRMLVLAADPDGVGGRLAPGAEVEIPILFRNLDPACFACEMVVEARVLIALPTDLVDWETLPVPPCPFGGDWNQAAWSDLRAPTRLPIVLGSTWLQVRESLASLAARVGRQGVPEISVRQLLRHASREALGAPTSAITGRLRDAQTLAPVAATVVVALLGNEVVTSTRTDASGRFALEGLEGGEEYRIEVNGRLGGRNVSVPSEGDRVSISLELTRADDAPQHGPPEDPDCESEALPPEAIFPPEQLLVKAAEARALVVGSFDPNEKDGPEGLGARNLVGSEEELIYIIYFENKAGAAAAARRITVTDVIDENLDLSSLRLRAVSVAGQVVNLDRSADPLVYSSRYSAWTRQPLEHLDELFAELYEGQLDYVLSVHTNFATRTVTWEFEAVDRTDGFPIAGREDPPVDPRVGMLPPNRDDVKPAGDGWVSFSIKVRPGLEDDEEIANSATIRFDENASIVTEPVINRHSHFLPAEAARNPRPADSGEPRAPVRPDLQWERTPHAVDWEVRLWKVEADQSRTPVALALDADVLEGVTEPGVAAPRLDYNQLYEWRVDARNIQGVVTSGDTWTFLTVPEPPEGIPFLRGDSNGDGEVDISDPLHSLLALLLGEVRIPCEDATDVNDDGKLDISDPITILNVLFLGSGPIPAPGMRSCGTDPTVDELTCEEYTTCP